MYPDDHPVSFRVYAYKCGSTEVRSENCILNSGSANDINKYNQCIANQMQMARNQNRMELEYLRNEIIKLKEENFVLKQKLDQIKDTLKN